MCSYVAMCLKKIPKRPLSIKRVFDAKIKVAKKITLTKFVLFVSLSSLILKNALYG